MTIQPTCAGCKQPITGSYVTATGKTWHPEHFTCAACGKTLAGQPFIEVDGKVYCQADYQQHFIVPCSVCGSRDEPRRVKNFWGDVYCERHVRQLPACFNCGRPVSQALTRGGVDLGDGRWCCTSCRSKLVGEIEINERILPRVVSFFEFYDLPLQSMLAGVRVQVVDAGRMTGHAPARSSRPPTGLILKQVETTTRPVIKGGVATGRESITTRRVTGIFIMGGLTEIHVTAVLAHEIGHAYMFANGFPTLPPLVEEGMAELFAFLWLRSRQGPEPAFHLHVMENNPDPVYGKGFSDARRYMAENGFWALLQFVKTSARFPR